MTDLKKKTTKKKHDMDDIISKQTVKHLNSGK